jgi:integrase
LTILKNQRIICASLNAGFMRSSELLNIKISDLIFEETYLAIFVEGSKTDECRDGSWIMIAKSGTCLCSVRNSLLYIE